MLGEVTIGQYPIISGNPGALGNGINTLIVSKYNYVPGALKPWDFLFSSKDDDDPVRF